MGGEEIKKLRRGLKLSQEGFAERFGFRLGTLRHWEQGSRLPVGPAAILLSVIKRSPDAVSEAISATISVR